MPRSFPSAALQLAAACTLAACTDAPARGAIPPDAGATDAQIATAMDAEPAPPPPPYWELDAGAVDGGPLYDAFVPVLSVPPCDADAGPCPPVAVYAGGESACVLWSGGTSACWGALRGRNPGDVSAARSEARATALAVSYGNVLSVSEYGELWASTSGRPARVGLGTRFRAVSAGDYRACVLRDDGAPSCFLLENAGLPSTAPDARPDPDAGGVALVQIANDAVHTCGLDRAGALVCWGQEIGGSMAGRGLLDAPTLIHDGPFEELEVAHGATCVRDAAGRVSCWSTRYGSGEHDAEPTAIALPGPASDFDLGDAHGCAVVGGRVYCWGEGSDGQLGQGALASSASPVLVPGLDDVLFVATGRAHTCAARRDARVWCWGSNSAGVVVPGSSSAADPTPLRGFDGRATYRDVAVNQRGGCAVETSGEITCWGPPGAQGLIASAPSRVQSPGGFERVVVDESLGCALNGAGELYCWGTDSGGALLGAPSYPSATRIQPSLTFREVALAGGTLCAITSAQALVCWGDNSTGLLGTGVGSASAIPQPVLPAQKFSHVAVGETAAVASDLSGKLYGWGARGFALPSTAPAALTFAQSAREVAAGFALQCALDSAGALYCWGDDMPASAGGATTTPTRIGTASGYHHLSARHSHVCMLDAQNHALCFGPMSLLIASLPTPFGAGTSFGKLSVDDHVFAGLDAAGHLLLSYDGQGRYYAPGTGYGFEVPSPTLHGP